MGPSGLSSFTRRHALLQAEELIGNQLAGHTFDSSWMQAAGKAAILEYRYDESVEILRRAVQVQPHEPALLTDLATALFQRGADERQIEDIQAAYEYLSQALTTKPDDPIALFNRAVVAEHLFFYQQAIADWKNYLRADSSSEWTMEAQARAKTVRDQVSSHEANPPPLLSSAQVAALGTTGLASSDVEQRIEPYLREALRTWLPAAFLSTHEAKGDQEALAVLATVVKNKHHDEWLNDLIAGSSLPYFAEGARHLSSAIQHYRTGDYESSQKQAGLAEKSFETASNEAGVLYAELFQTYSEQLSGNAENCRRRAVIAKDEAKHHAYTWIQAQLELQESVCAGITDDLGVYERASRRAQELAQQAGYPETAIRAAGFVADSQFAMGDRPHGLNSIHAGLQIYWSAPVSDLYAYNFYSLAADATESLGQPNLRLAMRREALAKIKKNPDPVQRAEGHGLLASAALAANQPIIANHEYEEARSLYALATPSRANEIARLTSEVRIAQVELRQGGFDDALRRLSAIEDETRHLSNNYLTELFFSTEGTANLSVSRFDQAERAFRSALPFAARQLKSLHSEAERMNWSKDAAPIYLGLVEAVLRQGRELQSLETFEWYLETAQPADRSPANISAPDPQRLAFQMPLFVNQTVLSYATLPDGLAIWVYDNRGVRAKWIPTAPEQLASLADDFYNECSDRDSDLNALRRDARALYSRLIGPIEGQLDFPRQLIVETDTSLGRLPFEALIDNQGHYLIERTGIVHSLGLYAREHMHPATTISSDSPTLIVASTASLPDRGLSAIPDLLPITNMVANFFHSPRTIEDLNATVPAVTEALPSAVVFHFAGHAITAPERTGLLLDGIDPQTEGPRVLDANLVRHAHLQNLQLAVLAACSTDAGQGNSRGFESVARAFESSGVPHVVATRWNIDLSEPFLGLFYQSLLAGEAPANAIRVSSRTMLSNTHTAHPYYWASFAAYGTP